MQPYFLPYIGYWQLMNAVDQFVVYDNIEFSKKGWIHRNRILMNHEDVYISLPLKKDSDYLHVKDRFLADAWDSESVKMENRINAAYRKAPHFHEVFPLVQKVLSFQERNLFVFILNSIHAVKEYLGISTPITVSSEVNINHSLKAESKVIAICESLGASTYVNPIGGMSLYNRESFQKRGIDLHFIKTKGIQYKQFSDTHVPSLSIVDMLMFNPKSELTRILNHDFTVL